MSRRAVRSSGVRAARIRSASRLKWRRLGSEVTGSYIAIVWALSRVERTWSKRTSTAEARSGIWLRRAGGAGETRSPLLTAISRSIRAATARAWPLFGRSAATQTISKANRPISTEAAS